MFKYNGNFVNEKKKKIGSQMKSIAKDVYGLVSKVDAKKIFKLKKWG